MRDYFYVDDAVAGYLALGAALMRRPASGREAFNFGDEPPVTVLEVVDAIGQAVGRATSSPVDPGPTRRTRSRHQWLDSAKAHDRLGWTPAFTLEPGSSAPSPWYREALA